MLHTAGVNPAEYADRWRALAVHASERAAYQENFRDLCALVGHPTPSSDTTGQDFAFEKHVHKVGTEDSGYADVFKRGSFAMEYKSKGKSLGKALAQLVLYQHALDNPPLLITSDLTRLEVHTNFTGTARKTYTLTLEDIASNAPIQGDLRAMDVLWAVFHDPDRLDPRLVRERLTEEATARVGAVARALQTRNLDAGQAAHFLIRVVFCMFAGYVGLLERGLLERLLTTAQRKPEQAQRLFEQLFEAMSEGGYFGATEIRHFNGDLFDGGDALPLTAEDIKALLDASKLDWAEVEPSITGTLFEESLEAATRSKRGAHYTNVTDILRVVEPVVVRPLRAEWETVKAQAEAAAASGKKAGREKAQQLVQGFHTRLAEVRVLDPACGSGNFLYVTLKQLLDLEHEVRLAGEGYGLGSFAMPPRVHPRQMLGVEVESFAQELAPVVLWIGFFQWKRAHGGEWPTPVLERLDNIQHRDALLNEDGTEFIWPEADFIVGNPPFLGEKKQRRGLGDAYVDQLRLAYKGRVTPSSDLVGYWVEKARAAIEAGRTRRAGFVTTKSIRQPKSLPVLRRVTETGAIFDAWANLPWVQDGAAVRVSIFSFDDGTETHRAVHRLEAEGTPQERVHTLEVPDINTDLTAGTYLRSAQPLRENAKRSFQGVKLGGPFDLDGDTARNLLQQDNLEEDRVNNADVVKPYLDGDDVNKRRKDRWVIDFNTMEREEAERYVLPFAIVQERLEGSKAKSRRKIPFWRFVRPRGDMRAALAPLSRFIVTSEVAKHRIFAWAEPGTVPSGSLVVITADDDFTFGVLSSSIHAMWADRTGQRMGVADDLRYTPTTCFRRFPFPHPTAAQRAEVEKWARHLSTVREGLLTKKRKATLTRLYNDLVALQVTRDATHPAYSLLVAQERLDAAVAAAYGWEWRLKEAEVLTRLLTLNGERVKRRKAVTA